MSRKILLTNIILVLLIFSGIFLMKIYAPQFFKNALLSNLPFSGNFPKLFSQKIFSTYTSITDIKSEMKLVTAKQQFDFINIMDGKNGRYLEIATYEVKAGIDLESTNPTVEIFSSDKINSVVVRKEADISSAGFYSECIRPVNIAYEQKAKDYAVELGILEKAKEKADETLENLLGKKADSAVLDYKKSVPLSFVPLQLEIAGDYLKEKHIQIVPQDANTFFRDSLVLESSRNERWKIRFGDSGRTFSGKFDDFYKSVFEANTKESSSADKDNVQIFRYFDPLYPKESEILSYASDSYRTFFILNEGRIYYIDAEFESEQTLLDTLAPSMIYFASSLRKVTDRKIDRLSEYTSYIENFFEAATSIRNGDSAVSLRTRVNHLLESSMTKGAELTSDEKLIKAVSDIKSLFSDESEKSICRTDDDELNKINDLIFELKSGRSHFAAEETRKKAMQTALSLSEKIRRTDHVNLALHQYLASYFLQNRTALALPTEEARLYENLLGSTDIVIASRPLIAIKTDSERNAYFFNLFKNRLLMSPLFSDTSLKASDVLKFSARQNIAFAYFNIPEGISLSDNEIYEKLVEKNGGHELDNVFVFVFCQREWDFGDFAQDNDIHALVLDNATLRLFLNIASQNIAEKATELVSSVAKKFLKKDNTPEFFFYGDWKKLRITPDEVIIAGTSLGTRKITKRGKSEYKSSTDYAEKSTIASVLEDLQHAYSYDDTDFYYNTLCALVDEQVQRHAYKKIFRPSPRILENWQADSMRRYNF